MASSNRHGECVSIPVLSDELADGAAEYIDVQMVLFTTRRDDLRNAWLYNRNFQNTYLFMSSLLLTCLDDDDICAQHHWDSKRIYFQNELLDNA